MLTRAPGIAKRKLKPVTPRTCPVALRVLV